MRRRLSIFGVLFAIWCVAVAAPMQPETAEINFDPGLEKAGALAAAHVPAWITKVEQFGGSYSTNPGCWQVPAAAGEGVGRLAVEIDRAKFNSNLVATLLFDADETADLAVQLVDAQGRVVVIDLFGNLVEVGREATTDTFIIPLKKYPSATKIVIRRISGAVKVYGLVLFPAVTEGTPDNAAIQELARVLGDPLSPENPLVKSLQQIARAGNVPIAPVKPAATPAPVAATPAPLPKYPAAIPPPAGAKIAAPPTTGLMAHWSFAQGNTNDASERKHDGRPVGSVQMAAGLRGKALRQRRSRGEAVLVKHSPDLDLKETLTVSAWIKYSSIAPRWGSQIVWYGDNQLGRDPWQLQLDPGGQVGFRSDRSVTDKPTFQVFDNELQFTAKGDPMLNQHVSVWSPNALAPETWYFVAATVEKVSPQQSAFKLYINGESVDEVRTTETVNYDTSEMWVSLGSVDFGDWQNFDGLLEDVRLYNRPLTAAEIKVLYQQPWQ